MRPQQRIWIRLLPGLITTALFLWLFLSFFDARGFAVAISKVSLQVLLLALFFLTVDYVIRIIRWWRILHALDHRVRLSACTWPFLVSIAVNNLLPFRAGDVLRVVGFRKQLEAPAMRVFGTLLIERLFDLMVLLMIFFVGILGVENDIVPRVFVYLAAGMAALCIFLFVAILWFSAKTRKLIHRLLENPWITGRKWKEAIARHAGNLQDAIETLRSPKLTLQLVILSFAAWTFEGAVFLILSNELHATGAVAAPWFALASGTLATLLPSLPGYIGTFDYFTAQGLIAYNVDPETATTFSVTVHVVLWFPLTIAGLLYFLRPNGLANWNRVIESMTRIKI